MKIEINCEALDKDVSYWYDTASPSDISNALYHGYKIVSDPSFGRKIDENDMSKMAREKEVLLVELHTYKRSLESIRLDTMDECKELNKERLQEKEERIEELKQTKDDE